MAENTTTPVTMEIINSEQFKRANIRFNGKPAEEIREELKKEGWFYSRNHNVWYPKNDAAENSLSFANHIKETYFPENQEVKIITEASEKDELAAMVKNGSSLNDILSKLSDMYGEDAVHEAFNEARTTLSNTDSTPKVNVIPFLNEVDPKSLEIALYNKNLDNYLFIQSSDEYGWDFTSYDKDFKEIDGGVSDDVPETQYTEDIREAAKSIIKSLYPESDYPDWEQTNLANFQSKVEEVEAAAYDKAVDSAQKNWENHDNGVEQANDERDSKEMNADLSRLDAEAEAMERANGLREMEVSTGSTTAEIDDTGLTPEQKEIRIAQSKFGDIVRGTFLALSDEEKEKVTTLEQKNTRYEKWFRPMVDEIMAEIGNGNKEVMAIVQNFDLNHESHVQGNKWYSADEAYTRDVQYMLLPEMYEKVQDRIKKEYEEKKIPYVVMYSSESPKFPSENKVYTVKEFNEILLQADSEFHNRKKYAEEKYGSADNYWDLERDDKLPEEDKGIQFGYDKTNFKFFNIPNPNNPEDTFSYEPSRYDIGDGNGSVFDYVRSTCSHDEFIEALNALETQLYFPGVTDSQRQFVEKTVEEATQNLKATLKEKMEDLDKAQNEYKELHKKWLIEATEADRVDEMLKNALDGVKDAYDSSMNDVFTKVLNEYPFASGDVAGSEFLKYTANEVKKMAVSELYLPSRNAQKAMNAEDYKTYNSIDWAKLRRIWEKFPANVNMTSYAEKLLQDKCAEKGMSVPENTKAVTPPETTTEVHTDNEIPLKKFIDSDMTFDEEDTILHNKVTGKYVWLYRETGGGVGKFEYDSSFNETAREPLSYAGMKSIIRGAILEKNMDEWTVFKDKRYFKPFQESEMSEEEREEFKQSVTSDNKSVTKDIELTPEDIELCEKVIPPAQFKFTMELTEGEEGEFFKNKMKEIADTYRRINTDSELTNEDGTHTVGFRYFLGDTEIFLSEIDSDGIGFGYNILNGDLQMSEWGSTSLEEIMKIPYIEMDYHVPANATIEQMLYAKYPEYFEEYAPKEPIKNTKPYNFFVNDTANLDLGIGAEFEAVTGLTAEQAVLKYAELKEKGLSPYIGLNIPGDLVFDDKEGQGAGIFTETEGKPSFYIGDNFVKGLKENDEHAQNVLAAYKELYENADKYILGVEKPNFVFDKEAELNRPAEPLRVYTFSPFGYEGTVVQVETDLRRGIPAYDIVGIADSAVKETRERIRAAFTNSGLDFPTERVLQSLSPADLRKDSPMDLSMALGILGQTKQYPVNEPVLALGELELSGNIRPVRGSVAAVNSAKAAGITNIVCDPTTAELLKDIDGIKILTAESLKEANEKLMNAENFQKTEPKLYKAETVQFNEEWMEDYKEALENLPMAGHFETIRAIEIAVAGKHNILATGAPGCGKTLLTQTLMPALTPKMTEEESRQITRINSLAGLDSPKRDKLVPPFRMPHQTATIEGICGGGPNCRPGEISLAHQGTLFMDETAEFRSSVIQMLRVPLESRQITLSRAGRSTSYPADFQLAMAMNPCPCGCYGSPDKICLDSARSIEMYWKKISDPLLDRVEIKTFVQKDEKDTRKMSIEELKAQIATAYEIQRKRGVYNSHMTPEEIQKYCKLDKEGQEYLDKEEDKLTPRGKSNLLKLSLTIANMDGREEIRINDLKEARELSAPVFEKPKAFVYNPNQSDKVNVSVNNEGYLSKPVDNFIELLTSTTTEKSEAHVFERDEADKQIKFLNDEQKTWGTNNSFKIENLPEVHEEIDGYSKDNVLHNYPNFGSKEKHTYKPNLRGGARVGSGRKPTGSMTERMTICLSILQSEELKRRAKEANLTVSKYLAKELKLDNVDIEEINKILEKAKNQKITAKPVPLESSLTLDDTNISRSQISDAEKERSRITEPVLNGERTGMYKAFKDFEDKGVFDIQGTTVKLAKNGGLTPTGWKQLQAAMEIYRSKKFETFRYIMIDRKTGEIADQLAITSHMPNFCNVSKPNDETLKQVISRAEEKDYLIAVCHNHPSGNTTESSFDRELTDSLDRSLRRNDGLNRFAGHIILDHDTFNLAVPSEARPGNCHWKKMEPMQVTEIDRFTAEPKPEWAENYVGGTTALKEVAKKINETENWNDDFIPVVFTNADRNITGVQYYSKNFFENESDKIRNEFQFAAMEAGAIGAFPVITDSLWEKLGKGATDFEAVMKAHVMNDAFTDVAFNRTTMTEKYDIEAGRNYYSFYRDQSDRKIDVVSTWTPEVNPRLFLPEGVGEIRNEKVFATSNTAKIEKENFPKNQIYSKRKEIDFDR